MNPRRRRHLRIRRRARRPVCFLWSDARQEMRWRRGVLLCTGEPLDIGNGFFFYSTKVFQR